MISKLLLVIKYLLSISRVTVSGILNPGLYSGARCRFESGVRVNIKGGEINLGDSSYFCRNADLVALGGCISIGGDFFCNQGCIISSRGSITIGRGVRFGEYVSIYDHNHQFSIDTGVSSDSYRISRIYIEDSVWVCRGAVILAGVRVGANSVIGPNIVVRRDVPPQTVLLENN